MKRVNEALTFYLFVVISRFIFASACSVRYSAIPVIENKVGTKHLLNTFHAASLLICATQCWNGCSCFGYHRKMKQCRLHAICDINQTVTEELGWRYYAVQQNGKLQVT
jgi:hypothetical protein